MANHFQDLCDRVLGNGGDDGVMKTEVEFLRRLRSWARLSREWRVGLYQPFYRWRPEGRSSAWRDLLSKGCQGPRRQTQRRRASAGRNASVGAAGLFDRRLALRVWRHLD
jgi:hypothetical protein